MQQEETLLLQAMYEEYLIPLKKFAAKLGVKIEDIEDLVHETFIEYYMRYPLDLPDKVRTVMLIRILRSKWIDGNRRMRGREILRIDNPDDRESILKGLMNKRRNAGNSGSGGAGPGDIPCSLGNREKDENRLA